MRVLIRVRLKDIVETIDIAPELLNKEMSAELAYTLSLIIETAVKANNLHYIDETNERAIFNANFDNKTESREEKLEKYTEKLKGLLENLVEFPVDPIPFELLEDCKYTPAQMRFLRHFIKK